VRLHGETGRDGVERSVGVHLGGVKVQLPPPNQPRLPAPLDDLLEEAPEHRKAEALAGAGKVGVVGERLVEVVAQVPPHREAIRRDDHQLTLRAQTLEEQDELEQDSLNTMPPLR